MNALASLLRALGNGDGNLLDLLPASAYRTAIGPLGWSRRSTYIVNRPDLVRDVLLDSEGLYPKSDLMVNALEPLIGNSIFVSSGETWQRQRAMVDPALSMMRISRAFPAMVAGVDDTVRMLHAKARSGDAFSLDLVMSHLTADIICRTVFTSPLDHGVTHDVFEAFGRFERSVAQTEIMRLVVEKAFSTPKQKPHVLAACAVIRRHLASLLQSHLGDAGSAFDDIATALVHARDGGDRAFTHAELIDQLGVLFLAGHETSASALTWVFYLLASAPDAVARIRAEIAAQCGDAPIGFEDTKKLVYTRNVFRETIRLYPPITFLPRVAMQETELGGKRIRRGALVIVAPWVLHRHQDYWSDPDRFDPDRFLPEREHAIVPNTYIPFGLGPRICAGAAFASIEAVLIMARLVRDFDFVLKPQAPVRPVARLTTRPKDEIMMTVRPVR